MKTVIVTCLGVLLWVEPVSAEVPPLKVSVHNDLQALTSLGMQKLTEKIDSILQRASRLLKDINGGKCDVTLKRDGEVGTFTSAPSTIKTPADLELAQQVPAYVKIVEKIEYCIGSPPWVGCSYRPDESLPKTIIVNGELDDNERPNIWAHEFGHTTGLHHRLDPKDQFLLMTPCVIKTVDQTLSTDECSCFRVGQRDPRHPENTLPACNKQDTHPVCPGQK